MKITSNNIAILEDDTHISKWVEESGRLDHDQNALPQILKYIKKGDSVIDIGAFIGDHTIAYANKVGVKGKVCAFEPSKESYECLTYNLASYSNVTCYNLAIGEEIGKVDIDNSCVNKGMSHLKKGSEIDVIPLDLVSIDQVDFIKIDCEGFELQVLKGAKNTISRFKPIMLIEINDATLTRYGIDRYDIFGMLEEYGYKYRNIYREQGLEDSQLDIICLPKNYTIM